VVYPDELAVPDEADPLELVADPEDDPVEDADPELLAVVVPAE
jgi:hypothetical protein